MMVEMTSDLCECRVQERNREKGGAQLQALALQYSMAITRFVCVCAYRAVECIRMCILLRFVNGIGDIAKDRLKISANLLTCVDLVRYVSVTSA